MTNYARICYSLLFGSILTNKQMRFFLMSPSSTVVLFPPFGIPHSHIDGIGTLNTILEKGHILPVITQNIPAGDLEMASQVHVDAFISLLNRLTSPQWPRCVKEKH